MTILIRISLGCIFFVLFLIISIYIYKFQSKIECEYYPSRVIAKNFVINLPKSTDRWKEAQETLSSVPNLSKRDGIIAISPPHTKLKNGSYGCYLAHLNVIEEIANSPSKENDKELWYVILEDDVLPIVPKEYFYERMLSTIQRLPSKADIIDMSVPLGVDIIYNIVTSPLPDKGIYKNFNVGLQCYAMTPDGAKRILKLTKKDNFNDYIDCMLRDKLKGDPNVYFTYLCKQKHALVGYFKNSEREKNDKKD